MIPCCERCGVSPDKFDEDSQAAIRLLEIQTSFTFNAIMCLDCRRAWYKFINHSTTMREFTETGFRLEHWRMAHRKTGQEDVEKGLSFVRKLNDLDEKLNDEAVDWLKAGVAKERGRGDRSLRVHDDDFGRDDD